jgi:hypothetical protein
MRFPNALRLSRQLLVYEPDGSTEINTVDLGDQSVSEVFAQDDVIDVG